MKDRQKETQEEPNIIKLRSAAGQVFEKSDISYQEMFALIESVTYCPNSRAGKMAQQILDSIFDEIDRIAGKD